MSSGNPDQDDCFVPTSVPAGLPACLPACPPTRLSACLATQIRMRRPLIHCCMLDLSLSHSNYEPYKCKVLPQLEVARNNSVRNINAGHRKFFMLWLCTECQGPS
jgi:hypothetical protein